MLRNVLLGLGVALIAVAVLCVLAGVNAAPAAIAGVVLVLAILLERRHYKRLADAPPGPGWQAIGTPGQGSLRSRGRRAMNPLPTGA